MEYNIKKKRAKYKSTIDTCDATTSLQTSHLPTRTLSFFSRELWWECVGAAFGILHKPSLLVAVRRYRSGCRYFREEYTSSLFYEWFFLYCTSWWGLWCIHADCLSISRGLLTLVLVRCPNGWICAAFLLHSYFPQSSVRLKVPPECFRSRALTRAACPDHRLQKNFHFI